MEFKLQLHEFFIEGGNREKSHVLLHITEPSTPEEKQKGYFFAVCELNNAGTKDIINLQNTVDEIESRYYEAPESIGENSLETVLKKINRENLTLNQENLIKHCVVGIVRDQQIVFSFCGKPKMLLFYKTKEDIYKKMDLVPTDSDEEENRFFSQIVEGKISPNDLLFIATPQLKEYFGDDRLQKIITSRPSRQSAQHIERVLSDIHNEISFGGLIIQLSELPMAVGDGIKKRPTLKGGSVKSLHNLFATEKNTANTMSPSIFPKINQRISAAFQNESSEQNQLEIPLSPTIPAEINSTHLRQYQGRKVSPPETDHYMQLIKTVGQTTWLWLQHIAGFIWLIFIIIFKTIIVIGHFLSLLFFVVSNYQNRRRNILDNWTKQWYGFKSYIRHLPKTTKIFFSLSFLILIIFVSSVITIRANQLRQEQEKRVQENIRQIIAHKNAAESAVIYRDDATALNESQAAKQLTIQLDCKKYKKECEDFNQEINGILSQIRKEAIVNPDLVYDWSKDHTSLFNLAKINNQILAISSSSSKIAVFDLLTKQSKNIDTKINNLKDITVPKENDYAAILYDDNNIILYNPKDESFKQGNISFPKPTAKISSLIIYNRRLYSLDITNNQIYKHENIKDGFGPGKEWIKDLSVDVKNGVSMTTDGDMFISKTNGTIEKLTAGNKQPFEISGLDPALKNGSEIWTYTDKQFVYLLDGAGKRLIVLQKDGHLKEQITTTVWKNPTGMIIDEQNKTAFILDSNKLYQINL